MTKGKKKTKKKRKPRTWLSELFSWPWGWPEVALIIVLLSVILWMTFVMDFTLIEFGNQIATGIFFALVVGAVLTWITWLQNKAKNNKPRKMGK